MRFCLFVPAQFSPDDQSLHRIDKILRQVAQARSCGFHAIFVGHHIAAEDQYLQPLQLLARIAAESGEMELGTSVLLLPFYHPVIAVEELTTLDIITRGKLIPGFGIGYRDKEFELLGIPKQSRMARFEEAIAFMRKAWTDPGAAGLAVTVRPVRRPHPPIWIGGYQDPGIRRAARLGDAWIIPARMTGSALAEKLRLYRGVLHANGASLDRDYPIIRETFVRDDADDETIRRMALQAADAKYRMYRSWGAVPADEDRATLADRLLCGTPETCVETLRSYQELGINFAILRVEWPGMTEADVLKTISLLGEKVLPALAG